MLLATCTMFKIAVLVFQCLAGQAPSYLSDDCQPVSDSQLRHLKIHRRVSFDGHTTRMVTGALLLRGRGSGTFCRLNC